MKLCIDVNMRRTTHAWHTFDRAKRCSSLNVYRDRHKAERIRRKALNDKGRLQNLMKVANPAGVLGVDSKANPASEVYGEVSEGKQP